MENAIERAMVLLEQRRYADAAGYLQQGLSQNPDNGRLQALYAVCLSELKKPKEALQAAEQAVGMEPEEPYVHYTLANVLHDVNRLRPALKAAREAVRLDPEGDDYLTLEAAILLQLGKHEEALETSKRALTIDSENVDAANIHSMALVHLNRRGEAGESIQSNLSRDPENAATHANMGYAALHAGRYSEARASFREALRLNPELEWARQGMREAMKAVNPLYRPMLGFYLWTERLSPGANIALLLSFPIAQRIIGAVGRSNPDLVPILTPLSYALLFFVYLTWCAHALADTTLMLSRDGRLCLRRSERLFCGVIGICFLGGFGAAIWGYFFIDRWLVFAAGLVALCMVIPISALARMEPKTKPFIAQSVITSALAGLGVFMILDPSLLVVFILAIVASTWLQTGLLAADSGRI